MAAPLYDPTGYLMQALLLNGRAPNRPMAAANPWLSPTPFTPSPMEPDQFAMRPNVQPSTQGWTGGGGVGAMYAGLGSGAPVPPPMPPQRPQMPAQVPMPPQRPADLPASNAAQAGPAGQEMQPGSFGQIRGFNNLAAIGDPQAYANQFAGGNLANIAARTYRNDDGTMWNDYYVLNQGA